jgi:DNA-binding beta-propeller fold protein YncE
MSDLPLPSAPELVDGRLGDDLFALTANLQPYQPVRSLPPTDIPLFVSEPVWAVANGCGADQEQFASPRGMAVDAQNGRVYVADSGNRRVVELDLSNGGYVTSYVLPQFEEPADVALEPASAFGLGGTLLVLDATSQSITRIDRATGEAAALALGTTFYHPRGLAVDWAGNIVVADTGGARVAVLDATGSFLTQFGGLETGLGQGQPSDVLALGDQIWAIAADHGRLWQLETFGSVGITQRASTVNGPQLAALPDGSGFFMSDPVRRTVLYFAPTGQLLAQLGYADHFANPTGVAAAFAPDGFVHLLVGDSVACSVSLWRLRVQ